MLRLWKNLRARLFHATDGWSSVQREIVLIGGVVVVIGVLAAGGYFFGMPHWRAWQQRRALDQVRLYAQRGDYRAMILSLQLAVELAPNDPDTWRTAAYYLAQVGSPEVVPVRRQLLKMAPNDTTARIELARDALALGQPYVAAEALSAMPPEKQKEIMFHRMAAMIALAMGRTDELEKHLGAVIREVPTDSNARFNYAVSGLSSDSAQTSERARQMLEALTVEPEFRVRAALALLNDTAQRRDPARLEGLLPLLLSRFAPGVQPDFGSAGVPGWEALLVGFKNAVTTPEDAVLLGRWLADSGRPREVVVWLEQLPASISSNAIVMDLRAELSAVTDDLKRLSALLADRAWGQWPALARDLAVESRALMLAGKETESRVAWGKAERESLTSEPALRSLARLAAVWRDSAAAERGWRMLLERNPSALDAYAELALIYRANDDLSRLVSLYGVWAQRPPLELDVVAQWIVLECVRGEPLPALVARAEALWKGSPDALPAVVALAAVRWRQQRATEAEELLNLLPSDQRAIPLVAFWLALVEADLGKWGEASRAIQRAKRANLLGAQKIILEDLTVKIDANNLAGQK